MVSLSHRIREGSGGIVGGILRLTLRLLQFVLAITVAGLYGVDLHNANKADAYSDGKWVYAEVVAGTAAVTCIIYFVTAFMFETQIFFAWDWILFILWTAVFGTFGRIFIPAKPTPEQHGQQRMKSAVWVDLVNMLLWLITAAYTTFIFFRHRNTKTLHTGRAHV